MRLELKKEFIERLKSELSNEYFQMYIDALDKSPKHGMTVNLHKLYKSNIDLDWLIRRFKGELIYKNNNFAYICYDKDELSMCGIFPGKDPLYHAGLYYIQEPTASKVLYDVDIDPNDFVLDLCASPGGKSAEILFSLKDSDGGFLVSNDIDFERAKVLSSNIERLGFDNVAITCSDSKKLADRFTNYFDKVIVDAPCSGEGMFRKSIEARQQWSLKLVQSMSMIQKRLVDDAYIMLKDSGKLIYSTCTFSLEEDEKVVDYLLDKYKDLKLCKIEKNYPFNSIGEGQFYAILQKGEELVKHEKNDFNVTLLSNVPTLRIGIEHFEEKKGIKLPTHASTHIESIHFDNVIELDDYDIMKYLKGESLRIKLDTNGYYKVTYKGLGIGLAKYNSGMLKNHYPKGLRNV